MCWVVAFMVLPASAELYYGDLMDYLYSYRRAMPSEPNYNETFFSALDNFEINSVEVTEKQYPWVARVVHSRSRARPQVCTAVCVEDRIFITAGRCLNSVKVAYTSIIYQQWKFPVRAFVVPSNKSKQAFDDIGFIVVNDKDFTGQWVTVQLFDTTNRTDENFNWFIDLNFPEDTAEHVVVGYAASQQNRNTYLKDDMQYRLTELEVVVNINICPGILIYNQLIAGFHIPCYHSCSVQQFNNKDPKCLKYHGVVGAAVLNKISKKLLGIVTWGPVKGNFVFPVGFSVPNSKTFFQDFTCARRIKLDTGSLVIDGYYQALCEDIN